MAISRHFGRQQDRDVVSSRSGIVLVPGDSGIGKTTFLNSLVEDPTPGEVVADAQLLRSTAGSLQNALATSLGQCLLESAHDATHQRLVWGRVKASVVRAGTAAHKELGRILITRATEVVEGKIGKEATKLIRSVVDELLLPSGALLEERLSSFTVPDIAEELGRLVRDVASATERTLVIPLDAAERLGKEDRALLVELSTELGPHVRLIATVNDHQPEGQELIRQLEARDSAPHNLGPLSHEAVEEWLLNESVPRSRWRQVIRIADGYPLFIQDAIRLVKDGVSLSSLDTPSGFQAVFDRSFRRLDAGMQSYIVQIAAFAEPPPDDYLVQYLNLSTLQLHTLKQKLLDEGVFIRRPDGILWFHDRRRAYLWNTRLSQEHRRSVAVDVLTSLQHRLDQQPGIEVWLAASAPALLAETSADDVSDDVARILAADPNELALLASMVELIESDQNRTAPTQEIAAHASARFSFSGDPIVTLEALQSRGMVALASNTRASVAAPIISTPFAFATLIGVVQQRLGVHLMPGRALRSFELFIKPLLGRFDKAIISLQRGTLAHHSATFREETAKEGRVETRRSVAGLGITLSVDDQPISVTALFENSADRDSARSSLTDGRETYPVRNHVQFHRIDDLPATRVAYDRYAQLLNGHGLTRSRVKVQDLDDLAAHLTARATAMNVMTSSLSRYDAAAFGLERDRRFIVDDRGAPKSVAVFEIETNRSRPTMIAAITSDVPLLDDPLIELRLRAQGMIEPDERLMTWTIHSEIRDQNAPVEEVLDVLIDRGRRFNRYLPPVPVRLDENELSERIREEMRTVRELEKQLIRRGVLERRLETRDDSLLVLLDSSQPSDDRWYPWGASTFWTPDGKSEVRVRMLPEGVEPPPLFTRGEALTKYGIENASEMTRTGNGIASSVLADLLGYSMEDIAIQDPRFSGWS